MSNLLFTDGEAADLKAEFMKDMIGRRHRKQSDNDRENRRAALQSELDSECPGCEAKWVGDQLIVSADVLIDRIAREHNAK